MMMLMFYIAYALEGSMDYKGMIAKGCDYEV